RRFREAAEQSPEGALERIQAPKLATFWLRSRLIVAQDDRAAQVFLAAAREAVSEGYADVATRLIRCEEWTEAGRLIQQGRDTEEFSHAGSERLADALAVSLRHEVERLTAPIIRGVRDESRAVAALERAERLLGSIAGVGLPPRHLL